MRSLGSTFVRAAAIVGLLIGCAAPALADHDDDDHWRHHERYEHRGDWDRHHDRYYGHDYDRRYGYYYDEPRVEYYSTPRVYVPPPPSFGLSLVFP
jgi:hypothetical protein